MPLCDASVDMAFSCPGLSTWGVRDLHIHLQVLWVFSIVNMWTLIECLHCSSHCLSIFFYVLTCLPHYNNPMRERERHLSPPAFILQTRKLRYRKGENFAHRYKMVELRFEPQQSVRRQGFYPVLDTGIICYNARALYWVLYWHSNR